MNILVTGGSGFVGSSLIEDLLQSGHNITNLDTQWFGLNLNDNKNLTNIKCDIRNLDDVSFKNFDAVVHLANIANDPGVELNPSLSWEINVLAGKLLIEKAIKNNIKKFIYASSGSVYGLKKEEQVTEDLELVPLSTYNKTKMVAERLFLSYSSQIEFYALRPATVCGLSPRMRLDVSVNLLTFQALSRGNITLFGGDQIRPNIHMKDMVNAYKHLLFNNIKPDIYNAGFENFSLKELSDLIKNKTNCKIEITSTNDPRSYRQNSDKLISTGFQKKYSVKEAINDITDAYNSGKIKESDTCYTVKWMKKLGLNNI